MNTKEEVEKCYAKYQKQYFDEFFKGKTVYAAMEKALSMFSADLLYALTKTCILTDCLCELKKDKNFFNKLNNKEKNMLKTKITLFKTIRKKLCKILKIL